MYEDVTPPAEVLERMAKDWRRSLPRGDDAAGEVIDDADLGTLMTANLKMAAEGEPEAARALDRLKRAMAALPTANSVVDVTPLGSLGDELGLRGPFPHVATRRTAPYDYAGSRPAGGHVPSADGASERRRTRRPH